MADKLLLATMFVMLTLPGLGHADRLPLWLTVLVISRDIAIVLTVAIVNLAVRAADVPAVAARQRPRPSSIVLTGVVDAVRELPRRALALCTLASTRRCV